MLKLWNTGSKTLEELRPIAPGHIGLYACGPTVYQRAHIGNLRAYVMEDLLRRVLEHVQRVSVNHVMNITDVGHLVGDGDEGDDKVEKIAREKGESAWDVAKRYTDLFLEDMRRLNITRPTVLPKATEHIPEQIALIQELERKGFVYATSDGMYFDTAKFSSYGQLGGQNLQDKEEGARVEANPEKRHPADFALWKFSPRGVKRQMEWESPWGVGFPGWHIECSAMSRTYLGQPFDIHAGGVDHIPVHHENEIAQSVCAYGVPLAHAWMHVEFLLVDGRKMSKSLQNDYSLDDLQAKGFDARCYRYFLLGAHYRTKQNFTWEGLEGARNALRKVERLCRELPHPGTVSATFRQQFTDAMEDDLNTPKALAAMWALLESGEDPATKSATLLVMDEVFGLDLASIMSKPVAIPNEIQQLAERRWEARMSNNWALSDALRAELQEKGWEMKDGKDTFTIDRAL